MKMQKPQHHNQKHRLLTTTSHHTQQPDWHSHILIQKRGIDQKVTNPPQQQDITEKESSEGLGLGLNSDRRPMENTFSID
jgi:hypothetical protein